MNAKLTKRQVSALRRSNKTDSYHARRLNVTRLTILRARTALTFRNVQTPALRRFGN